MQISLRSCLILLLTVVASFQYEYAMTSDFYSANAPTAEEGIPNEEYVEEEEEFWEYEDLTDEERQEQQAEEADYPPFEEEIEEDDQPNKRQKEEFTNPKKNAKPWWNFWD